MKISWSRIHVAKEHCADTEKLSTTSRNSLPCPTSLAMNITHLGKLSVWSEIAVGSGLKDRPSMIPG